MSTLRLVATGLMLSLSGAAMGAQQRTSVFDAGVSDLQTGAPIVGAEVLLPDLRLLRRSDSLGRVVIAGVPHGTHRVRVRLLGYAPSEVRLTFTGDTTGAVFRLDRAAIVLRSINVSADAVPVGLKDFEIRRKQGIGRFLTEQELTGDADRDFMNVATVRFPGLTVRSDADGRPHIASTRSSCGGSPGNGRAIRGIERIGGRVPGTGGAGADGAGNSETRLSGSCTSTRPCLVKIYLDDVELGEADDGLIRTWDLSGVEYHTGASMPARYRVSASACGVLLLWSKWR